VKTLRQICAASIITLTLAVTVLAGHIETPAGPVPPPATLDDHVKLRAKLPCIDAITSDFARNFPAQTQSRQASSKTSQLRHDQVVIDASR
jgi:hypothetical protein